jgi:hypothetical protein
MQLVGGFLVEGMLAEAMLAQRHRSINVAEDPFLYSTRRVHALLCVEAKSNIGYAESAQEMTSCHS